VSRAASTSRADPAGEAFGFVREGVSECAYLAEVAHHWAGNERLVLVRVCPTRLEGGNCSLVVVAVEEAVLGMRTSGLEVEVGHHVVSREVVGFAEEDMAGERLARERRRWRNKVATAGAVAVAGEEGEHIAEGQTWKTRGELRSHDEP